MSSALKGLLIFTLGTAFGAVGTYVVLNKKFEDRLDAERRDLRRIYSETNKNTSSSAKTPETASNELTEAPENDIRTELVNKLNMLTRADVKDAAKYVDYTNLYKVQSDDDEDQEEDIFEDLNAVSSMNEHPDDGEPLPYLITLDQWGDPIPAYNKVTVNYYIEDDVLVDALSHEVMDIPSTVGESNLKYFDRTQDECIYVRNDAIGIDYEIERVDNDYSVLEGRFENNF